MLPALERAVTEDPKVLHAFSDDGWTALHLACFFGHQACVTWLLARGADREATSQNMLKNRPLHAAAGGRHTSVCAELLRQGAVTMIRSQARSSAARPRSGAGALPRGDEPADAQQQGGYTALHSAAQHGNEALVEVLLSAGASPSLADGQGKDAAQHAEDKGHRVLSERLRGGGVG